MSTRTLAHIHNRHIPLVLARTHQQSLSRTCASSLAAFASPFAQHPLPPPHSSLISSPSPLFQSQTRHFSCSPRSSLFGLHALSRYLHRSGGMRRRLAAWGENFGLLEPDPSGQGGYSAAGWAARGRDAVLGAADYVRQGAEGSGEEREKGLEEVKDEELYVMPGWGVVRYRDGKVEEGAPGMLTVPEKWDSSRRENVTRQKRDGADAGGLASGAESREDMWPLKA